MGQFNINYSDPDGEDVLSNRVDPQDIRAKQRTQNAQQAMDTAPAAAQSQTLVPKEAPTAPGPDAGQAQAQPQAQPQQQPQPVAWKTAMDEVRAWGPQEGDTRENFWQRANEGVARGILPTQRPRDEREAEIQQQQSAKAADDYQRELDSQARDQQQAAREQAMAAEKARRGQIHNFKADGGITEYDAAGNEVPKMQAHPETGAQIPLFKEGNVNEEPYQDDKGRWKRTWRDKFGGQKEIDLESNREIQTDQQTGARWISWKGQRWDAGVDDNTVERNKLKAQQGDLETVIEREKLDLQDSQRRVQKAKEAMRPFEKPVRDAQKAIENLQKSLVYAKGAAAEQQARKISLQQAILNNPQYLSAKSAHDELEADVNAREAAIIDRKRKALEIGSSIKKLSAARKLPPGARNGSVADALGEWPSEAVQENQFGIRSVDKDFLESRATALATQAQTDALKTKLDPAQEPRFQNWFKAVSKGKGLDPNPDASGVQYDWRGAFQSGAKIDRDGALPEAFKIQAGPVSNVAAYRQMLEDSRDKLGAQSVGENEINGEIEKAREAEKTQALRDKFISNAGFKVDGLSLSKPLPESGDYLPENPLTAAKGSGEKVPLGLKNKEADANGALGMFAKPVIPEGDYGTRLIAQNPQLAIEAARSLEDQDYRKKLQNMLQGTGTHGDLIQLAAVGIQDPEALQNAARTLRGTRKAVQAEVQSNINSPTPAGERGMANEFFSGVLRGTAKVFALPMTGAQMMEGLAADPFLQTVQKLAGVKNPIHSRIWSTMTGSLDHLLEQALPAGEGVKDLSREDQPFFKRSESGKITGINWDKIDLSALTNPKWWARNLGENAAQMVGPMAIMAKAEALNLGSKAVQGARAILAEGTAEKTILDAAEKTLARFHQKIGYGTSALMETQGQLSDASKDREGNYRDLTGRDYIAAGLSGFTAAAFDAIPDQMVFDMWRKAFKGAPAAVKKEIGGKLAELGKDLVKGALLETPTEAIQTVIENAGAKYGWDPQKNLSDGVWETIAITPFLTGGGTAITHARGALQKQAESKPHADYALAHDLLTDLRAKMETARANGDGVKVADFKDQIDSMEQVAGKAAQKMTSIPGDARRQIGAILGGDGEGLGAQLDQNPALRYAATAIGEALRPVYLDGGKEQAIATALGAGNTPATQAAVSQLVGAHAIQRDLAGVLNGGKIEADKAEQFHHLGLLELEQNPDGSSVYKVTDDALPFLPKGIQAAVAADQQAQEAGAPAKYQFKVTAGSPGAIANNLIKTGEDKLRGVANALVGSANAAQNGLDGLNGQTDSQNGNPAQASQNGNAQPGATGQPGQASQSGQSFTVNLSVDLPGGAQRKTQVTVQAANPGDAARIAAQQAQGSAPKGAKIAVVGAPALVATGKQVQPAQQRPERIVKAVGHFEKAYAVAKPALVKLGITGVKEHAEMHGPMAVDNGSLLYNPDQIAALIEHKRDAGMSEQEAVATVMDEEMRHAVGLQVIGDEEAADIFHTAPDGMKKAGRRIYGGKQWDQMTPTQRGHELLRMVMQRRWLGRVTEQIHKAIKRIAEYLGVKFETLPENHPMRLGVAKMEALEKELKSQELIAADSQAIEDANQEEDSASDRFEVSTPQGNKKARGRYRVVEASELATSDRPGYNPELQRRQRDRSASKAQVAEIAHSLDPGRLGESATSDTGAPIINAKGEVLSGNGRTMALRQAYDQGGTRSQAYREFVAQQAQRFGIADQLEGIRNPVLVRQLEDYGSGRDGTNETEFADLSNRSQLLGRSAVETAMDDARMLREEGLLDHFSPGENGDILTAGNRQFNRLFVQFTADRAQLLKGDGSFSPELEGRVRRAVLAALMQSDARKVDATEAVTTALERADKLGLNRQINGIMSAAGRLLKLQRTNPAMDIAPALAEALAGAIEAKGLIESGKAKGIEDAMSQGVLFAEPSPAGKILMRELLERPTANATRELLGEYARIAESVSKGPSLFGEQDAGMTPEQVLENIANKADRDKARVAAANGLRDALGAAQVEYSKRVQVKTVHAEAVKQRDQFLGDVETAARRAGMRFASEFSKHAVKKLETALAKLERSPKIPSDLLRATVVSDAKSVQELRGRAVMFAAAMARAGYRIYAPGGKLDVEDRHDGSASGYKDIAFKFVKDSEGYADPVVKEVLLMQPAMLAVKPKLHAAYDRARSLKASLGKIPSMAREIAKKIHHWELVGKRLSEKAYSLDNPGSLADAKNSVTSSESMPYGSALPAQSASTSANIRSASSDNASNGSPSLSSHPALRNFSTKDFRSSTERAVAVAAAGSPGVSNLSSAGSIAKKNIQGSGESVNDPSRAGESSLFAARVEPESLPGFFKAAAQEKGPIDISGGLNVAGHPHLFGEGLGIPRAEMPQIPEDTKPEFYKFLRKRGISLRQKTADALKLKPTQNELDAVRIGSLVNVGFNGEQRPILVSSDGYVIDGHHRWGAVIAAGLAKGETSMPVIEVGLPIRQALAVSREFMRQEGIEPRGFVTFAPKADMLLGASHVKDTKDLFDVPQVAKAAREYVRAALKSNAATKPELERLAKQDGLGDAAKDLSAFATSQRALGAAAVGDSDNQFDENQQLIEDAKRDQTRTEIQAWLAGKPVLERGKGGILEDAARVVRGDEGAVRGGQGAGRAGSAGGGRGEEQDQSAAERSALLEWAIKNDRLIPTSHLKELARRGPDHSGTEHSVYLRGDEPGRVEKVTLDRPQFIKDYLERLVLTNIAMGDQVELKGVSFHPGGTIAIVTSQPFYQGVRPSQAEVDEAMRRMGYAKGKDPGRYYGNGLEIADSFPHNWKKSPVTGRMIPFDVRVHLDKAGQGALYAAAVDKEALGLSLRERGVPEAKIREAAHGIAADIERIASPGMERVYESPSQEFFDFGNPLLPADAKANKAAPRGAAVSLRQWRADSAQGVAGDSAAPSGPAPSVSELVKDNMGLAVNLANQYRNIPGHDFDNTLGEARKALVMAARGFDPQGGAPFGSYAGVAIRNALNNLFNKSARRVAREGSSADFQLGETEHSDSLKDRMPDPTATASVSSGIEQAETKSELEKAMEGLPERVRSVLDMAAQGQSLREIGAALGFSHEMARRILSNGTKAVEARLRERGFKGVDSDGVLFAGRVGEDRPDEFGIHPVATPRQALYDNPDERRTDPASILRDLVRGEAPGDAGSEEGADPLPRGSGAPAARQRWKHGRQLASHAGMLAWARRHGAILDPLFAQGIATGGGEHQIGRDPESDRLLKLTKPGFYGAQGVDAGAYLQRWALANHVFGDDARFAGMVKLPGEDDYRAAISQPNRPGRDSTKDEIRDYLERKGFREIGPDRWVHPVTGIAARDALTTPGNAITGPDKAVHPVDISLEPATSEELTRARAMSGVGNALYAAPVMEQEIAEEADRIQNPPKGEPERPQEFLKEVVTRWGAGRLDSLDYVVPGAKDLLTDAHIKNARIASALRIFQERIQESIRKSFGYPSWWRAPQTKVGVWRDKAMGFTNADRIRRFSAEILPTAARLNAAAQDATGKFSFESFWMRAGELPGAQEKAMGLNGIPITIREGVFVRGRHGEHLKVGKRIETFAGGKKRAFWQLERFVPAAEQERLHESFHEKYPEAAHWLDSWINPNLRESRIQVGGIELPDFNRFSLHQFWGELSPFGPVAEIQAYTPDIFMTKSLAGMIAGKIRDMLNRTWTGPGREYKSGEARERGQIRNLFEGFNARAAEAHMETERRKLAEQLLEKSLKPIPDKGLPSGYVRWDTETIDQLLRSYHAAQGLDPEQYQALKERVKAQAKAMENGETPNTEDFPGIFDAASHAKIEKLAGKIAAEAAEHRNMMIHATALSELRRPLASTYINNGLLRMIDAGLRGATGGYLANPFTLMTNQLSNEIFVTMHAAQRAIAGLMNMPFDKRAGWLNLYEAGNLLKGVITDRWYNPKVRELVPDEMFDGNHRFTTIATNEFDKSPWELLQEGNVSGAILHGMRYGNVDVRAKQRLVFASYLAHGRIAYEEAKAKGKVDPSVAKAAWIKDWVQNLAPDSVHRDAYNTAVLVAMDYANVPPLLDESHQWMAGGRDITPEVNMLRRGIAPFAKFPYNLARQGKRWTADSARALLPGNLTWSGVEFTRGAVTTKAEKIQAAANLAMMGMMFLLARLLMDDDKDGTPKLGREIDDLGKRLDGAFNTSGRINITDTPLGKTMAAALDMMGLHDLAQQEAWLRIRNYPYASSAVALANLTQKAMGKPGGQELEANAMAVISDMVSDGILLKMANAVRDEKGPYDKGKNMSFMAAENLFDMATGRFVPPPLLRTAQAMVDPVSHRSRPTPSLDYDPGALAAIRMKIPGAAASLPTSGSVRAGAEGSEKSEDAIAQTLARELPEGNFRHYIDPKSGKPKVAYVMPGKVQARPRVLELFRAFGLNVKFVDQAEYERELAGID